MTFVEAFAAEPVLAPDQVLPTVPRAFGERFDLNWKAARAPDKSFFYETRMQALYDDALDRLQKATGQTFPNPFTLAPAQSIPSPARVVLDPLNAILFGDRAKAIDAINQAFDTARAGQWDLPNPRLFEDQVRGEATRLRQDAEKSALATYGAGGLGAFLGAAAGEMSHPVNLATLPLGGEYAIANIARVGLLRFIGRATLAEAGVAAASQAAIEALDAPLQERLGTDTGLEDRLERILIAGAGGAALGAGLSGLVGIFRGLRGRSRLVPTLDEADSLKVAERASYAERNPPGPERVNEHAAALNKAEVEAAAGRHQDFDIRDSGAATRPIAAAAPLPSEKVPPGMKEAKADEARAMVMERDFEVSQPDGTRRKASEFVAGADDRVKATKIIQQCAAGGAIG